MGSELKVRVGINHAGFATGLKTMESMIQKFAGKAAGALGAAIGVHALYESAKGGIELADRLDDLSKRFDISATKLQMLGNVAGQEGAGLEEVAQSLKFLGKNAQDAASGGSTELLDIFTNLGLTIEDLKTLKADEIFLRIADSFNSGKYAGQELVILSKLLGRGFEQLAPLIRMSREELEQMGKSKGTFASDEDIKQLAQVADFMEKIANLRNIMAGEVTLGFMKSFKEFLSAGESGSVAEKLKKMLFPDTTEKGKNPIDTKQQLAVREAADKALLKNKQELQKAEEALADAIRDRESAQMDATQKLGRAQAELLAIQSDINILQDNTVEKINKKAEAERKVAEILGLQESSSASILKATDEQAKATERASALKEKLQTLEAERAGPRAEMRLMEERAQKAASQARETGNIEDAAKAQELANQLQKAKEAEFRAAKFGDSSAGFARQSVNQIVGEIPAAKDFSMIPANSLRDIPSSTEAQRTQPVRLENPPNLQGVLDKLDLLIKNAGVFS